MPRKPKFVHPIRALREMIGKSQPQFAKLVGTSSSTIQSIELGRLQLSFKLAMRVSSATYVDPLSIMQRSGSPTFHGKPYTEEHYQAVSESMKQMFSGSVLDNIVVLCESKIDILIRAAAEKGKAYPLLLHLEDFIWEAAQEFGLAETVQRLFLEKYETDWHETSLTGAYWNIHARISNPDIFKDSTPKPSVPAAKPPRAPQPGSHSPESKA